jgi:two-component system, cell cycle sensor histidine kinase and response regulator CckA
MTSTAGNILLVDDEPSLLKMMSVYLGRLGYAVIASSSTDQAWAQVEAAPAEFAVAILDGSMPGMGMETLALNMLHANPLLCVIVASGYPMDLTAMQAAGPGRVTFLQKPFSPEMLALAVRRIFATQEEDL